MKRRKKLWIMGAVLGLVLVLTVSAALIDHTMEKIQASGENILEIPGDSVTALSWDYNGQTLSFVKEDQWQYTEDPDFPVSESAVEDLLEPLSGLNAAFRIEKVEDYSQYGLETPTCTIRFTADGQDYEVRLGDYSKMDSQRYADIGDGNVYLLNQDPMEEYDRELRNMIRNDRAPYLDHADQITFTGKENYTIRREPEGGSSYREEDLYFADRDGQLLPLDTASVENYLSEMTLVDLVDYRTYTASQEDLSQYGLDQPELTVETVYTQTNRETEEEEQKTYVLHIARDPEALKEAEAAEDPESVTVPVYARVGDSEIIYEIQSQDYDKIAACGYDDLRHAEIFPASTEDITAVSISLDGRQYRMEKAEPEEEETGIPFLYEDRRVDLTEVLSALRTLHAEEFIQNASTGKREIRLELTIRDADVVTVELYRLDGSSCLARVDGQVIAKLPRTQVVDLMEKINAIVLSPAEAPAED